MVPVIPIIMESFVESSSNRNNSAHSKMMWLRHHNGNCSIIASINSGGKIVSGKVVVDDGLSAMLNGSVGNGVIGWVFVGDGNGSKSFLLKKMVGWLFVGKKCGGGDGGDGGVILAILML